MDEEPFPDFDEPVGAATGRASRQSPPRHVARRRVAGHESYASEMRRHEAAQRQAAETEMRAEGLDPATGENRSAPAARAASRPSATRSRANARNSARQAAAGAAAAPAAAASLVAGHRPTSLATGVLGVIAYAIGINYLRGGWPQVKGWFAAKFVNRPYGAPAAPAASSTSSATPANRPALTLVRGGAASVVPPGSAA